MARTGVLARNQSDIATDLLAALKPLHRPDDQHEGQRRQRAHTRMRHQPQHFGLFLGFLLGGSACRWPNERSAYGPNGISKFRQSPEPFTSPRLISIGKGNEDIPAPLTMSQ